VLAIAFAGARFPAEMLFDRLDLLGSGLFDGSLVVDFQEGSDPVGVDGIVCGGRGRK
jgi:hypothetical protein